MNQAPLSEALLIIQDLSFAYPGVPVFSGLSAALPAGVCLVCGDEGTGKSSLLRLLAGDLTAAQGRMLLGGHPLMREDVAWFDAQDAGRHEQVARDILEELVAPPQEGLAELIDGLSLAPHLHKPLYQLSTGSRRKVFIAAALARQARVTLLDQPFMALDKPSVDFLRERFARWNSPDRVLLIADYTPPEDLPLAATLDLDSLR